MEAMEAIGKVVTYDERRWTFSDPDALGMIRVSYYGDDHYWHSMFDIWYSSGRCYVVPRRETPKPLFGACMATMSAPTRQQLIEDIAAELERNPDNTETWDAFEAVTEQELLGMMTPDERSSYLGRRG